MSSSSSEPTTATPGLAHRLLLSEESLRLAIEAGEIGTWDLDLVSGVLTWSTRTKAMFGLAADDPCSMDDFYAGLHPEDQASTSAAFASALDPMRRATYAVQYRTVGRRDGVVRWVAAKGRGLFDADGRCYRAIGTAIDITEQRDLQERLRVNEAALRELNRTLEARVAERTAERDRAWNNAQDLLAVIDVQGRFRAVNPAWTQSLGWEPAALIDRPLTQWLHAEDLTASAVAFDRSRETALQGFENRLAHRDGSYRWFSWTATPEGELIYASGRDVTEVKRQAAELADAQEHLRHAQKLEAISQLSGGIAHDFNNLMMILSASLELLQDPALAPARRQRCLDFMTQALQRGTTLTRHLLTFSRRNTFAPCAVNLVEQLSRMDELVARSLGAGYRIDCTFEPGLWPAMADPAELELAVLNLCVNARDAMPAGGPIAIACTNRPALSWRGLQGDFVCVRGTDTGVGMSKEITERIFEPFFTTKPVGQGTGLGLPQVLGFAQRAGGQVTVDSTPGAGTAVCVWLPRAELATDAPTGETAMSALPVAPTSLGVALMVEDDAEIAELVGSMLEQLGYQVETVATADEGIARLSDRWALVFSDVVVPGERSGVDLAQCVRERFPYMPVLLTSGYTRGLSEKAAALGVEVLGKPYRVAALAEAIGRARDRVAAAAHR
jgi:PAS domain S-box-containing protein